MPPGAGGRGRPAPPDQVQAPGPLSGPAFTFEADLWEHQGPAAWYFLTLPHDVTDEIDELTEGSRRGFGSVRVQVTVGATTWATSIFPDTKAGSFLLPVKKDVRRREGLDDGTTVAVTLELVDPVQLGS